MTRGLDVATTMRRIALSSSMDAQILASVRLITPGWPSLMGGSGTLISNGRGCTLRGVMTGDDLRLQRGRLHLTQRELADRVGVGLRTVTTWEALGAQALPGTARVDSKPSLARLTAPGSGRWPRSAISS